MIGAGKSVGSRETTRESASMPPADEPMTTNCEPPTLALITPHSMPLRAPCGISSSQPNHVGGHAAAAGPVGRSGAPPPGSRNPRRSASPSSGKHVRSAGGFTLPRIFCPERRTAGGEAASRLRGPKVLLSMPGRHAFPRPSVTRTTGGDPYPRRSPRSSPGGFFVPGLDRLSRFSPASSTAAGPQAGSLRRGSTRRRSAHQGARSPRTAARRRCRCEPSP